MMKIFLPIAILMGIILSRRLPRIGGNPVVAFLCGGAAALITGNALHPEIWLPAWFKAFDSIAFAAWIILLGSIFSTLQIEMGSIDLILDILRVLFGRSAPGLTAVVMITLYFSGAVMGTTLAAAATVGILVIPILNDMKLEPEMIAAMIISGASMGSIMPPVSNSVVFAAGLMGMDAAAVIPRTYLSVGLGLVIICLLFCKVYVGKKYTLSPELIPQEKASKLLRRDWRKLLPIAALFLFTVLPGIPAIHFDVAASFLKLIVGADIYQRFAAIPVLGKLTNTVALALLFGCMISFVLSGRARKIRIFADAWKKVRGTMFLTVAMAFFVASYTVGGQIGQISVWASGLSGNMLIWGGAALFLLAGMILGSQANSMTLLIPVFAPALMALGIPEANVCAAISHMAMAGQGMPPADTNAFAIAGIVEGVLQKKVNAQKAMLYSLPYCIYLFMAGLVFCYL